MAKLPTFYSSGAENFLRLLQPIGPIGRLTFPPELKGAPRADLRLGDAEQVWDWSDRVRAYFSLGDIDRCQIDVGCGIVAEVEWRNGGELARVCCQCVVSPGVLLSIGSATRRDAHYLRLDYDESNLGPLLCEPLPHLHVRGNSAPRVEFRGLASKRLLGSFLDFIYRNYFRDSWETWARAVWERARRPGGHSATSFDEVWQAFLASDVAGLTTTHREKLRGMKRAWRRAITDSDGLATNNERCGLLSA